eukprot:1934834-Rhodomonas_salina.4
MCDTSTGHAICHMPQASTGHGIAGASGHQHWWFRRTLRYTARTAARRQYRTPRSQGNVRTGIRLSRYRTPRTRDYVSTGHSATETMSVPQEQAMSVTNIA